MFSRWRNFNNDKSFHLIGPRRAGKSTLLKKNYPNYQYTTLDDLDDLKMAKEDPKGFIESLGSKFIVDEFQRLPDLSLAVKKFIDEKRGHAILTGSTGMRITDKASDTLAGRIRLYHLPPCCWGEEEGPPSHKLFSTDMAKKDVIAAQRRLDLQLRFGGFPEIIDQQDREQKKDILKNYKNTYFTRDLALLENIENVEALLALYQYLIISLGARYEFSNISRELGISIPTVKKYIASLVRSNLAFKLYGYHFGPAKRYISSSKTYFCDNSIIESLSPEIERGKKIENFVISEIEKRRKLDLIEADHLFYYESTNKREIDLILETKKVVYAIEIKSTKTITGRDIANLKNYEVKAKKPLIKIIYYMGTDYDRKDNIDVLPIATLFRAGGL